MTKRRASASPLAPRKRRASSPSNMSAESSPGLLAPIPPISPSSPSPNTITKSQFNTSEKVRDSSITCSASRKLSSPPSAPALDNNGMMLDIPPTTNALNADKSTTGLTTPATREPSHDGTVTPSTSLIPFNAPDNFPCFRSGDVVITTDLSSSMKSFQLHSLVLARHSTWFGSSLSTNDGANSRPRWYSFTIEEIGGKIGLVRQQVHGECPVLHNRNQDVGGCTKIKTEPEDMGDDVLSVSMSSESESGTALIVRRPKNSAAVALYDQIFGAFYNIPPRVSTKDIGEALVQSEELVKVAGDLGCLHLIRPYLGNVFGQFRQKLFVAIKSDPARWIQLAIPLQNQSIYTECMIHLVGAHPCWRWPTKRTVLTRELRQVVATKSKELEKACLEVERDLLLNTIEVGKGPVTPQDRSHIETWTVVQLFRDTLAQQLHQMDGSRAKALMKGKMIRAIRKGGSAYLEFEETRDICQRIMQSSWRDLGEDLKRLKGHASEIVKELAENELMIDPDANDIGYLTCVKIQSADIPWQAEA